LTRGRQNCEQSDSNECLRSGLTELQRALEQAETSFATSKAERDNPPTSGNTLAQDPELLNDFITESREHLAAVENGMLILDGNPVEIEAIHGVFRGFHTIKGLAGFLEFEPIRDVAHEVETLLGLARNSKITITKSIVDVVLESVDYLNQAIEAVARSAGGTGLVRKKYERGEPATGARLGLLLADDFRGDFEGGRGAESGGRRRTLRRAGRGAGRTGRSGLDAGDRRGAASAGPTITQTFPTGPIVVKFERRTRGR